MAADGENHLISILGSSSLEEKKKLLTKLMEGDPYSKSFEKAFRDPTSAINELFIAFGVDDQINAVEPSVRDLLLRFFWKFCSTEASKQLLLGNASAMNFLVGSLQLPEDGILVNQKNAALALLRVCDETLLDPLLTRVIRASIFTLRICTDRQVSVMSSFTNLFANVRLTVPPFINTRSYHERTCCIFAPVLDRMEVLDDTITSILCTLRIVSNNAGFKSAMSEGGVTVLMNLFPVTSSPSQSSILQTLMALLAQSGPVCNGIIHQTGLILALDKFLTYSLSSPDLAAQTSSLKCVNMVLLDKNTKDYLLSVDQTSTKLTDSFKSSIIPFIERHKDNEVGELAVDILTSLCTVWANTSAEDSVLDLVVATVVKSIPADKLNIPSSMREKLVHVLYQIARINPRFLQALRRNRTAVQAIRAITLFAVDPGDAKPLKYLVERD